MNEQQELRREIREAAKGMTVKELRLLLAFIRGMRAPGDRGDCHGSVRTASQ